MTMHPMRGTTTSEHAYGSGSSGGVGLGTMHPGDSRWSLEEILHDLVSCLPVPCSGWLMLHCLCASRAGNWPPCLDLLLLSLFTS